MILTENRFKLNRFIVFIPLLLSILVGIVGGIPLPGFAQFSLAQFTLFTLLATISASLFIKYPFLALSAYLFVASWKDLPFLSAFNSLLPTGVIIVILLLRSIVQKRSISSTQQRKNGFEELSIFLLILFILYGIVNSVALSNLVGVEKVVRFMVFTLPIYFVISSLFNSLEAIQKFLYASTVIGGAFSLLILLGGLSSDISSSSFAGALGFEENRILSGRTAGVALILGMSYLLFQGKTVPARVFASSVVVISLGALLYSYSRGALISAVLACGVILYSLPNRHSIGNWIRLTGIFALVLIPLALLMQSSWAAFINRFSNILDVSSLDRLAFYQTGISYFIESPLWGIGLSNFSAYSPFYGITIRTYPHNILVEVLSETGIIGGILFFLPILYTVRTGIKMLLNTNRLLGQYTFAQATCFASFIFFCLSAMFSGDIQMNRYMWLFAFLMWQLSKEKSVATS